MGTKYRGTAAETRALNAFIKLMRATNSLGGNLSRNLADKADFRAFNEAYARHFSDPLPVRTTVQAELMLDAGIEVTVIAQEHADKAE